MSVITPLDKPSNLLMQSLLIMASVLLLSCSKQNDFSGAYVSGGGSKYAEAFQQELFIQKLVENEIEFVTRDDGMVTYKLSDLSKIRLIQDLVEGREKEPPTFGQTAVLLPETEFVALFEKSANESHIRVEYQDGSYKYFMWEFKYRKQIYIIEQNVRFELHENLTRQLKTKTVN